MSERRTASGGSIAQVVAASFAGMAIRDASDHIVEPCSSGAAFSNTPTTSQWSVVHAGDYRDWTQDCSAVVL